MLRRWYVSRPISRVLYFSDEASIIYLRQRSPVACIDLPLPTGEPSQRAAVLPESYRNIHGLSIHQTYGGRVATNPGELLPRLFTLTLAGGCFLLCYYPLAKIFPLGSMVLYIARTFLFKKAIDRPTDCLIGCRQVSLYSKRRVATVFDYESVVVTFALHFPLQFANFGAFARRSGITEYLVVEAILIDFVDILEE